MLRVQVVNEDARGLVEGLHLEHGCGVPRCFRNRGERRFELLIPGTRLVLLVTAATAALLAAEADGDFGHRPVLRVSPVPLPDHLADLVFEDCRNVLGLPGSVGAY